MKISGRETSENGSYINTADLHNTAMGQSSGTLITANDGAVSSKYKLLVATQDGTTFTTITSAVLKADGVTLATVDDIFGELHSFDKDDEIALVQMTTINVATGEVLAFE